jgi:hypothetical protein
MPKDTLITKVQSGMRIISADQVCIGKVRRVHFRDTEAYIEILPRSFWNTFLEVFALRQMQPSWSHLFLSGDTISQVVGKRVYLKLGAEAVRACVSRPPWIEPEEWRWT